MRENRFQSELIADLKNKFVGCLVLKNDAGYLQGIPDLSVLYKGKWALLECKESAQAPHRPNQQFYIDWANKTGGFGRFIFPENKEEVLNELQSVFEPDRKARDI